jgi:hypothetical protein
VVFGGFAFWGGAPTPPPTSLVVQVVNDY